MSVRSSMKGTVAREPSPAEAAAEWLATLTDDSCTDEERQCFVEWLKRSNLHVDEFLRISALTRRLTRAELWPRYRIETLIEQAHAAPSVTALPEAGRARAAIPFRDRFGFALAAAVAPLIVIAALLVIHYDPFQLQGGLYSTAVGELRSITLEDGSVVELNTRSKIRTHFTPALREVRLLSGEAVFKVAKNPARPFRVSAGSTQIVAVGTEFNVYARQSKTVVTVIEGRVRVVDQTPANNFELSIGEQAVIAPHRPVARVKLADSRSVMSWTERRLIFEDTPLAEAADEFARYNPKLIHIEDAKLRELKVSGVFSATDPASLVEFVETYGNVKVQTEPDGWTLDSLAP